MVCSCERPMDPTATALSLSLECAQRPLAPPHLSVSASLGRGGGSDQLGGGGLRYEPLLPVLLVFSAEREVVKPTSLFREARSEC